MSQIALLAPVPLEHLEDGLEICTREGKVAFGSRAFEVFRELDALRNGQPVDALIYASSIPLDGLPSATWCAKYIGHVESKRGAHPDSMRFRPPSTGQYADDNKGHWAVFWEVKNLKLLTQSEHIEIRNLRQRSGRYYKSEFIPYDPTIITAP